MEVNFVPRDTDGSPNASRRGLVAGFGLHLETRELVITCPFMSLKQATVQNSMRFCKLAIGKVVIIMDSKYVYEGLIGCMHWWDETH